KIMMSGGVASPYDPLDSLQFSPAEVAAAVQEAQAFGRYVCAHAYTPEAMTRAAQGGVRVIEHGNLIDDATAKLMAEKGMFMVANLVTYYAMRERAAEFGMTGDMLAKNDLVIDGGLRSLEICKRAGVPVGYGTDLLGALQVEQSREFVIRSEVMSPIEIIRAATTFTRVIPIGRWLLNGTAGIALGFILLPLVLVTWLAFFRQEIPSFPPEGYSLQWFGAVLNNKSFVGGFILSFEVGVIATLI